MLTNVTIHGPLAEKYQENWTFDIETPIEAIRALEANNPGFIAYMREINDEYPEYRVVVETESGEATIAENELSMLKPMSRIHFIPVIKGAGKTFEAVAGVALIALAVWNPAFLPATGLFSASSLGLMGASILLGGIAQAISPNPIGTQQTRSWYFNGPVNVNGQGFPVPLIYGKKVLVGSNAISAIVTVQ